MAKKKRNLVLLVNPETGYSFVRHKSNKPGVNEKMSFMKFDPTIRKHAAFKEKKMPSSS